MVAEPEDERCAWTWTAMEPEMASEHEMDCEMIELNLPPSLTVRFGSGLPSLIAYCEPASPSPPPPPPPKVRRGAGAKLAEVEAENAELRKELKLARREAEGAKGQAMLERSTVEDDKRTELRKVKSAGKRGLEEKDAELRHQREQHTKEVQRLTKEIEKARASVKTKSEQVKVQMGKVMQVQKAAQAKAQDLKQMQKAWSSPEEVAVREADFQEQLAKVVVLKDALSSAEAAVEELTEHEAELQLELSQLTDGRRAGAQAPSKLEQMKKDVGVKVKYQSVPARTYDGECPDWRQLSVRHMAAVLEGRGEGDNINMIAEALHRCGYLERLVEADRFQPIAKGIVTTAMSKVQDHWTPRHAVHIWDRLELSRSQMETLHHLLSFIYNADTDRYVPIRVWENLHDKSDYVLTAKLASRVRREREYESIAAEMNIVVGSNGRCERDAVECTSRLYTNYAAALREIYTVDRPAQPILYLDGTGGPLGRGICHGEIGCADFKQVGDSDAKQSRATLQPLFLYQGNDHAEMLRSNLDLAMTSYNRLVDLGCFDRTTADGSVESILARPMTVGDMQGAKATYGMRSSCHAVWCKCRKRERGATHHAFATKPMETYEEVCKYITEKVGCKLKTFDEMCAWAHYSPGVARGRAFSPFKCSCCGYEPTERKWRADLKAYHGMSDDEQASAQAAHMDSGDPLNSHFQHYHQILFMPPLPHHGMGRCGVDDLHLTYLNAFKHFFKYTVHEGLPETKKKLVSKYCRDMGFYSYDAASLDDDPCSHWIGREVKRFITEAHLHLPFLLQIAAAPADCVVEMAACANIDGEEEMEYDEEYAPTDEQVAEEEALEPLMMVNAARWDRFLAWVHDKHDEWPQGEPDSDIYRQGRTVRQFNFANAVCNDWVELKPTLESWVPHIMAFIAPMQLVPLGDASRRSADACESFGAMAKKLIKHATCRRPESEEKTQYGAKSKVATKADRRWQQTFKRGFIEQAFKRLSVRESLQHGEANAAYLQRRGMRRVTTGKAAKAQRKYVGLDQSPAPQMPSILQAAKALGARPGATATDMA